ncbi:MAG: ribosome small subunit-dependent GTPase A [Candidatus Neomarinimicrobiota bacterium]
MALLASYGLTDPIRSAADALMQAECQLGRIITSVRDQYRIITEHEELPAQTTGRFLFTAEDTADLPVTGDWVVVKVVDDRAIIIDLIPRRTSLVRKSAGRDSAQQIVAANVDTVFIVQSLDRDFNLRRLERYLLMAYDGRVEPAVLLSKQDLLTAQAAQSRVAEAETVAQGVPVLAYSALDNSGLEIISALIQPGQTFCLVGSSGVGKSTLINRLLGESRLETRAVREKDSRGRHTTARRELILLDGGGILIDTPGMRELGVMAGQSSLETTFPEIEALADKCHYRGCRHQQEPGCAVREAVEGGDLPQSRYESFLTLSREVAYNASQADELSRLKRKRAQKQISKLSKTIKEWKPRF